MTQISIKINVCVPVGRLTCPPSCVLLCDYLSYWRQACVRLDTREEICSLLVLDMNGTNMNPQHTHLSLDLRTRYSLVQL